MTIVSLVLAGVCAVVLGLLWLAAFGTADLADDEEGVIAERRGAVLTRRNGRIYCTCPFACLAACEPCEFAGIYDKDGRKL